MPRWSRWTSARAWTDDRGSASLEFITTGLILLVPLVFLILPITVAFAIFPGILVLQTGL